MKILFVCTGNSCRSPMAEHIARHLFSKNDIPAEFASAGVSVLMALPASPDAIEICENYGFDMSDFKTRQFTKADYQWADLILTMTKRHKSYLSLVVDDSKRKIMTIGEYIGMSNLEIPDPFGKDRKAYKECADKLYEVIKLALEKIQGKKIAIGCDHAGLELKKEIIEYLQKMDILCEDYGTYTEDSIDYPVFAKKVTDAVTSGASDKGILVCGTGIGMSIAANKVHGIRAALCHDTFSAKATREHNDANVLALGARVIGAGLALDIVKTFIETEFSDDERHIKRIALLED